MVEMATAQQTRTPRRRTAKAPARRPAATTKEKHGVKVPIPVVTPHVKVLHVPVPGSGGGARRLPPPDRLVFYGALGAMAVFDVISWPVAAAIGAGTVVARRARRSDTPGR
jgi:hypothetical protein